MTESTLNLERFATLLAQLAHGGRQEHILDHYGIDRETWYRTRRDWLRRLAAVRPPNEESHVFATLYARALLELEERRTSVPPTSQTTTTNVAASADLATLPSEGQNTRLDETLPEGVKLEKSPESYSVDAAAFVMKPLMDTGLDGPPAELEDTIIGPRPTITMDDDAARTSADEPSMSPEAYARLACATHLAPSIMRERMHHELGIIDEAHRSELDRAMTRYFERDDVAYQVYLGWVAHLRRG